VDDGVENPVRGRQRMAPPVSSQNVTVPAPRTGGGLRAFYSLSAARGASSDLEYALSFGKEVPTGNVASASRREVNG
jgi:hypothetical protein